jgi:hypothetical protein
MSVIPQSSLFLGIIPALLILYISLKGFEGYYKEKTVFLIFIAGLVLGFIAAFARSFIPVGLLIYIALLAVFDQLFKTIVLNIGRFHGKRETVIYGLTLGLGFGSVFTPYIIISVSTLPTSSPLALGIIALGSLGIILFHGATGAFIGYGVYEGKLMKFLLPTILVQIPFSFFVDLMIVSSDESFTIELGIAIGLVIYGIVLFWVMAKRAMARILRQTQRRKRST